MTSTFDINNTLHRTLLAIAARINVANSEILLTNAVQDLMAATDGKPMETRVMASSLATAAISDALCEVAMKYARNNPGMVSELDCAITEERTKLQKKLDNAPTGAKSLSGLSMAYLHEIEGKLVSCKTTEEFACMMDEIHPLMADSSGLATIRFFERILSEMLIKNIIPDYCRLNTDDYMTATRFNLWQNLDRLCGASTIPGLDIDDYELKERRCPLGG